MATVYLATDLRHDRLVAVKVLEPALAHVVGAARFLREIGLAARLSHPLILPLHDSGSAGEFLYYVMPYVAGESLRDRLNREKQLPIDQALRITREIADALDCAHEGGIVHRDIKPENILLASRHAVVADFGIARALQRSGGETITGTGIALGTPAYMSPEQAAASKDVDGRSDLYSLGCVLYEMLAGQPPFTGRTPESILRQHLTAEPPDITIIRPGVPPSVVALIARSLAKTPADRFESASAFLGALEDHPTPWLHRPDQRGHALPAWATASLAALVVLVTGGVVAWREMTGNDWAQERLTEPPPFTMVAEFEGSADQDIRLAVGRLARTALESGAILSPLSDDQVRRGLTNAGYADTATLTSALAHELAIRGSLQTIVVGAVERVGAGYLVIVGIHDVDSAAVIATSRATADDEDDLIPAVDIVMRDLQAAFGRTRSHLRPRRPPAFVMTPSFEAYKHYALARRIQLTDVVASAALLRKAIALDGDFASAWQMLAVVYQGEAHDSALSFAQQALRRSHRLTQAERFMTEALIAFLRDDYPTALQHFDRVLLIEPGNGRALMNRCEVLWRMAKYGEAAQCHDVLESRSPFGRGATPVYNHADALITVGRLSDARRLASELRDDWRSQLLWLWLAAAERDWARADSLATTFIMAPGTHDVVQFHSQLILGSVRAARGAVGSADSVFRHSPVPSRFSLAGARSFLSLVTGRRPHRDVAQDRDTTPLRFFEGLVHDISSGDARGARANLDSLRSIQPTNVSRRAQHIHTETVRFATALLAAHEGDWQAAAQAARTQLDSWPRARLHLFARWLLATAFDRLSLPDSAIDYYEQVTDPTGFEAAELGTFGIPFSLAHQRLVVLYSAMGRVEDARRHWAIFRDTFTEPDPEYVHLLREAQSAVEEVDRLAR